MNVVDDVEVRLVKTPTLSLYVDLAWVGGFALLGLRRMRRSRPGWHAMLAAGFVRIYVGLEP